MAAVCLVASGAAVIVTGCARPTRPARPAKIALPTKTATASKTTAATKPVRQPSGIVDDDLKPDYSVERIGCGDLLEIAINDLTGPGIVTKYQKRVTNPDGGIDVPLIKHEIIVADKSEAEAQQLIADAYLHANMIANAQVVVTRVEARSACFTVMGSGVDKPGEYPSRPTLRILTALADAGVHFEGQNSITLLRTAEPPKVRTINIPVAGLLAGDPRLNVNMRAGDVVILPTLNVAGPPGSAEHSTMQSPVDHGQYWVGGTAIKRAGVYQMSATGITLRQAIVAAGDIDKGYVCVFRRRGRNESVALWNTPYADVLSGAASDLSLEPGDTVMANIVLQLMHAPATQASTRQ